MSETTQIKPKSGNLQVRYSIIDLRVRVVGSLRIGELHTTTGYGRGLEKRGESFFFLIDSK